MVDVPSGIEFYVNGAVRRDASKLGPSGKSPPSQNEGGAPGLTPYSTTFNELLSIRWCCVDLLRPPPLIGSGWRRTPLESSANSAVSLLEQEKHCQHAEEEKREAQPCHVVHRNLGILMSASTTRNRMRVMGGWLGDGEGCRQLMRE